MIDLTSEQILPLRRVPALLEERGLDRVHCATLYRWQNPGIVRDGERVRLETARVGGARVTSVEALQRFVARLSAPRRSAEATAVSTRLRRRALAVCEAEGL